MACEQPDDRGYNCNGNNCWYENTGYTVGNLCNRSLGGSCVADHFNDLGEGGVLAYAGCLAFDETGLVYSSSGNKIAGRFVHRDALSCKGGLVDCAGTFQDHAVYWNVFTRADNEDIAFYHLVNGNGGFCAVTDDHGCLGGKLHQAFQGVGCFALGAGFQHFSHCDQGQDHGSGLKVKLHHVVHYKLRVAVYLCAGHGEQCVDAPYKGCHGAKGYQGVHVRGAVPQALEAADEEFLVDDHDDSGKQQLDQSHGYVIAVKPCGQRPAPHHMSHGEVHQDQKKAYGCDEALLQDRGFVVFQGFLCVGDGFLLTGCALLAAAVSGLFYG